jgi:hypothetical protein
MPPGVADFLACVIVEALKNPKNEAGNNSTIAEGKLGMGWNR